MKRTARQFLAYTWMFIVLIGFSSSTHAFEGGGHMADTRPNESKTSAKSENRSQMSDEASKKGSAATPYTPIPSKPLPTADATAGPTPVMMIPIRGTIDMGLPAFIIRSIENAPPNAVLIFDIDTFGGRVDAAVKIRDAVLAAQQVTVAYINRRAISAGALISLAADFIIVAPGASMGAATPVNLQGGQAKAVSEKMVSYMRSEMRATAEANGRDGRLAEAMVDADSEIMGVVDKGKLLTVTSAEALKLGLASDEMDSVEQLASHIVGPKHTIRTMQINWAERIARFLTDPTVSGFLMSLGMLGLLLELYTPGFGLAGGFGMVCIGLFFGGHGIAHLAGWEELTLFGFGIFALGIELFVLPGFGIAGVIGLGLIGASLVLAMLGMPVQTAWTLGLLESTLTIVVIALGISFLAFLICLRWLPSSRFGRWLVLTTQLTEAVNDPSTQRNAGGPNSHYSSALVGAEGRAITDLRPTGKMQFGEQVLDVISQGGWIPKGALLRIIDVEAFRTTVVEVDTRPSVQSDGLPREK